jgi:hypothetical protein
MSISTTARLVRLANEEGVLFGCALVIAEVVRTWDQPTMASEMMKAFGVTVRKAKSAGVEEYDLRELRKAARD